MPDIVISNKHPSRAAMRAAWNMMEENDAEEWKLTVGQMASFIDAEFAPVLETLRSDAGFLRRFLEQLKHVPVKDERGYVVNSYAAALIPDWEMRQRLDDICAALGEPVSEPEKVTPPPPAEEQPK
ncbi:MAG TPA: hypothetical protein VFO27_09610 [Bryobacteraceae bacterium]|nr:hypothetical protein [Bryobacteraceae bacterium]